MRLHIGASPIQITNPKFPALRSKDWIHLGEPEPVDQALTDSLFPDHTYIPFYYRLGDALPYASDEFTFAFSEHFFEHLFLDEACELMRECHRVLKPLACLRIVVPDADLRSYQEPEPAGYSTGKDQWFHPDKHKTRWSIYSLPYVLNQIGFETTGVVYCDKFGNYQVIPPRESHSFYADCLDKEIVLQTGYIDRYHDSLIVDAKKRGAVDKP